MRKQIISAILAVALTAGIFPLYSCGEKSDAAKTKAEHVYKATGLDLGENFVASRFVTAADRVIVWGYENEGRDKNPYAFVTLEGDSAEKTLTEVTGGDNIYITDIAPEPDGGLLLLMSVYKDSHTTFRIDRVGKETTTICADIGEVAGEESIFGSNDIFLDDFAVDGDGRVCIACEDSILVLDRDMNKLFEFSAADGGVGNLSTTSDGRVRATLYTENGQYTGFIDIENREITDKKKFPGNLKLGDAEFLFGDGHDLYVKSTRGVFAYDETENGGEVSELMNYMNSDIDWQSVRDVAVIDEDTLLMNYYEFLDGKGRNRVLKMERVPDDEIPEKYLIRLAHGDWGATQLMSRAVMRFNRQNDDYRVELINYKQFDELIDGDHDRGRTLEKELIAGTAPDIVLLADFNDSNKWISMGAFSDLNEFIKKDRDFDRADYFESVLDACTDSDGRMCGFVTNFGLSYLTARSDLGFDKWDMEKFADFALNVPDGKFLFSYLSRDTILSTGLIASIGARIKSGDLSFTENGVLKKLLEAAKKTPDNLNYQSTLSGDALEDYNDDRGKPYRDGTFLLEHSDIYDIKGFMQSESVFGYGSTTLIGYPASEGNGALFAPRLSFGINADSAVGDGAWEFIKFVSRLGDDATQGERYSRAFPTYKPSFEQIAGNELGNLYYITFNQTLKFDTRKDFEDALADYATSPYLLGGDPTGTLEEVTKERIEALEKLIDGAIAYPDAMGIKVIMMIYEEAGVYFSDAKTLDETVKIIENRVSTYISEKN